MREKLFVEDIVKLYKMPNGNLSESIGLLKEYMLNLIVSLHLVARTINAIGSLRFKQPL